MLCNAKVQDYMNPAITVSTTTPIRIAQQLMEDRGIRHLPVVHENKLVGILSSGDIRRAGPSSTTTLSIWEVASLWEQTTVEQQMSHDVVRVRPETLVTDAVQLMVSHQFNSLPVVDSEDRPIGIVTEVDVFRLLLEAARETTPVPVSEFD